MEKKYKPEDNVFQLQPFMEQFSHAEHMAMLSGPIVPGGEQLKAEIAAEQELAAKENEASGVSKRGKRPDSVVSAADLAGNERPTVIVTLSGQGIQMICVYIGDPQSGYEVTCADSTGVRWTDRRGAQWKQPGGVR